MPERPDTAELKQRVIERLPNAAVTVEERLSSVRVKAVLPNGRNMTIGHTDPPLTPAEIAEIRDEFQRWAET